MFEYLTGIITAIYPDYLVLDVNGIGYKLIVANPYYYEINQQPVTIYVYQAVRDNDVSLFGFIDLDEKRLFEKLISVSGIGPKSALAILAGEDHQGLIQAINNEDVKYLTKFPGVGKKTAQQIILDLKDKLGSSEQSQTNVDLFAGEGNNHFLEESLTALEALGYSKREIKAIKPQLLTVEAHDTNDYLRAALRLLHK